MEVGIQGTCVHVVKESDLASSVALSTEDSFPKVLATSRVIALMEIAAARIMRQLLQPGQLSVGVSIDIKHFAPTPAGEEVEALAKFIGLEGKIYLFEVEVSDKAGKVAAGKHTRAIIDRARLEDGARARMATSK